MLSSVNLICLIIDQKLIPISYINKRREKVYWEGSSKISQLKKCSPRVTTSTAHDDANNVLLLHVGCSCNTVQLTFTKGGQV